MARSANGASVAIHTDCRFLLVKRASAPYLGHWSLPGGGIETGESPEATARRELMEELGLTTGPLTYVTTHIVAHNTFRLSVFLANGYSGTPTMSEEVTDWAFVHVNELGKLTTTPGLVRTLELCLSRLTSK